MNQIIFATGNSLKFKIANDSLLPFGIVAKQESIDIDEIQGENPELIAIDKARKAFQIFKKPIIISDDTWSIQALNGFPGAYMKSINSWFTSEDFIRLMKPHPDKTIILKQLIVYADGEEIKLFSSDSAGIILDEPRGSSSVPSQNVISMVDDNGKSISEAYENIPNYSDKTTAKIWGHVGAWLKERP